MRPIMKCARRISHALSPSQGREFPADSGEALRKSEAKAWAILANAADGILTTDADGRIEWANPTGAHIFDYKPEELEGKNIKFLVPGTNFRERNQFPPRPAHAEKGSIISIGREVTGRK